MKSSLQAAVLVGTAALAVALGAIAAHAGELEDLIVAKSYATMLEEATGSDDLVSKALKDPDSEEVVNSLMDLVEEVAEE